MEDDVEMSKTTTKNSGERRKKKRLKCFLFSKIILAALPTIVFGAFTVVFTIQQDISEKNRREQDQRIADETNQRIIFKEYIDDMKELLFESDSNNISRRSLLQIEIQTLTVLKALDHNRKREVIRFLYRNRLIRRSSVNRVSLRGADLSNLRFGQSLTESCDFPELYLPGIYGQNIVFKECLLWGADFSEAIMPSADFDRCLLSSSNFQYANLSGSILHSNHLLFANFTGANLTFSTITDGFFQSVDASNVDFHHSRINFDLTERVPIEVVSPNNLLNTRFPNGSFVQVDQSEIIPEARSPPTCAANSTHLWEEVVTFNAVTIVNATDIQWNTTTGRCFFQIEYRQTIHKNIQLYRFSNLIDSSQASVNVSFQIGMLNSTESDQIIIMVTFSQREGTFDYNSSLRKIIQHPAKLEQNIVSGPIPIDTKILTVSFYCLPSLSDKQFCILDQVDVNIFQTTPSL